MKIEKKIYNNLEPMLKNYNLIMSLILKTLMLIQKLDKNYMMVQRSFQIKNLPQKLMKRKKNLSNLKIINQEPRKEKMNLKNLMKKK